MDDVQKEIKKCLHHVNDKHKNREIYETPVEDHERSLVLVTDTHPEIKNNDDDAYRSDLVAAGLHPGEVSETIMKKERLCNMKIYHFKDETDNTTNNDITNDSNDESVNDKTDTVHNMIEDYEVTLKQEVSILEQVITQCHLIFSITHTCVVEDLKYTYSTCM